MAARNQVQVIIGGKIYSLCGYESEDYLQKVAAYLNKKLQECRDLDSYGRLSPEMKGIMMNLNIADDYYKVKQKADDLEKELSERDKEIYDLRHELITAQVRLESAEKECRALKEKSDSDQKMMMEMNAKMPRSRKKEG